MGSGDSERWKIWAYFFLISYFWDLETENKPIVSVLGF
jgi:hypothetical protein